MKFRILFLLMLPVMDGFTVIEKTNGNRSIKKKPIFIVISSMGNQSMVEYACKLGVHYYIMKPYNLDSVIHRMLWTVYAYFSGSTIVGWASLMSVITFFSGITILFMGIIGEYIASIFVEVKNRPTYIIDQTLD